MVNMHYIRQFMMGGIFRMWYLALLVLLFCTHSWASCTTSQYRFNNNSCSDLQVPSSYNCIPSKSTCTGVQSPGGWCTNYFGCSFQGGSSKYCIGQVVVNGYTSFSYDTRVNLILCDTQAEADSAYCALNPNAEGCGNCKAADTTWYNNAVDSCNAVYGENNYSIVDTNDVCEHRGHCCSADSTIDGNVCTWKCESAASQCQPPLNFYSGILLDTTASDTGDVVQGRCYYNCIHYVPSDTTKAMVSGNILLAGPVSAMSQGTKVPNAFNSVRITDNVTYIYDYLFPQAEHYLDSIAFTPCVQALYRGVLNGKYVYWYDGQAAPAGVSNIVKVK